MSEVDIGTPWNITPDSIHCCYGYSPLRAGWVIEQARRMLAKSGGYGPEIPAHAWEREEERLRVEICRRVNDYPALVAERDALKAEVARLKGEGRITLRGKTNDE